MTAILLHVPCSATASRCNAARPSSGATADRAPGFASMPVPGALDQIVQHFGVDQVAEVTGQVPAHRGQGRRRPAIDGSPSRAGPGRPISPKPRRSWTTRSASWCSATPAGRAAAIMRISALGTGACACTTCWSPAGRPTPPSRVSAVPTAPTRRSRRCSGRSPPT